MSSQNAKPGTSLNSSGVLACLRDLTAYIHRSNLQRAESAVSEISEHLKSILGSPVGPDTKRAEQTSFALDEVRTLLSEGNFKDAAIAARDAVKEWNQPAGT